MQEQLNNLTFKKNNLKSLEEKKELTVACFNELLRSRPDKPGIPHFDEKNGTMHWWIQQYTFCALMELQELEESTDAQNDVVEMIDIWHFIMSMMQVAGAKYDDIIEYNEHYISRYHSEDLDSFFKTEYLDAIESSRAILRANLYRVISFLPWKHWSSRADFSYADVYKAINSCMWAWIKLAKDSGIDGERLHSVYVQKNKVNIERQMKSYNDIANKDAGNASIKV
jgi:hypothetical protein